MCGRLYFALADGESVFDAELALARRRLGVDV
jgi:hypothetical protein